ncbi:MAG: helix-turn-helix domain-containing protein, partial [Muribaculaceae bacterium]|nr:helix-turn-helix domain-containing protein [Muribaculaceae bacterium]
VERINARRMQFYMDMSHDMRSPLTLILGPLESMLKEELGEDLRNRIRGVYRNAHRILATVNQLLDLKRIDYGKKSLKCMKTNLPEFIREIVEMFQPQANDNGLELSFVSEGDWKAVWVDRSVVDRIMVNLISNALKYTPANGKVEVFLGKSKDNIMGKCIKISVSDNGIGLDSNFINHLFNRYVRSENGALYSEDGFGIGLDICRRYVMLHHGEIYGENRMDGAKGSKFTVLIPIDECKYTTEELIGGKSEVIEEANDIALAKEQFEVSKRHRNVYAGSKILVVEDDLLLRESLYNYFNEYYKVSVAADGEEGYKLAQELKPDVIITDVKMPRTDGIQLLAQLKFNVSTKHIPVVILSSKNELPDRISGWQEGAEAYVGKPFDFNELRAIVFNLIDCRRKLDGKVSDTLEKLDTKQHGSSPKVKGNDESLIEKVDKILEERIDEEDMNVDSLAEAVGVSRTHLYRRMKDRLGMNPSDYIRTKRLQRACDLLRNDDLDVTQIAYVLGFSSQSQFSTTFKRFMGYTPTEYRLKYAKETGDNK